MTKIPNRIGLTLVGILLMAVMAMQRSGEPWFFYPFLLFTALFFVNAWVTWNPRWFRLTKTVLLVFVAVWLCAYIIWEMMNRTA